MMRHAGDPNMPFWTMLKRGHDAFAAAGRPPVVTACAGRYVVSPGGRRGMDPCSVPDQDYGVATAYGAPAETTYAGGVDYAGAPGAPMRIAPVGGGASEDGGDW